MAEPHGGALRVWVWDSVAERARLVFSRREPQTTRRKRKHQARAAEQAITYDEWLRLHRKR